MAPYDRDHPDRNFDGEQGNYPRNDAWNGPDRSGYRAGPGSPYREGYGRPDDYRHMGYRGYGMGEGGFVEQRPEGRGDWGGPRSERFGSMRGYEDSRPYGGGFGGRVSRASELMTENPEAVTGDTSIQEVARKMRDLDVGIIPVIDSTESRRLRGVVTDRDIAIRAVAEGLDAETTVEKCMTDRVRSVNKNDAITEVMRVMGQEQIRRVPVTDREGRLVGIIAQADLAVDFAHDNSRREMAVGETLERISAPARPERMYGMDRWSSPRHGGWSDSPADDFRGP